MANDDLFEFSAKVDIEVEKSSLDKAKGVLDAFYNKYDDRRMKVNTSDMVKAFRGGITEIRKLYDQGMQQMAKDGYAWWDTEDGIEDSLNNIRNYMHNFFSDIKVAFSDGSLVSGLDDILSKSMENVSIVAVDLGARINNLQAQIIDTVDALKQMSAIRDDGYGPYGFDNDDMSAGQLQDRIALLKDMLECQKELEEFRGKKFSWDEAPSGMATSGLKEHINLLRDNLGDLEKYNLATTKQLERRNQLIQESRSSWDWTSDEHDSAKANIHDDDIYQEALNSLDSFIEARRKVIQELKDSEYELFSVDGISEHVDNAMSEIARFEKCKQELQDLKSGKTDAPVIGDLSKVVDGLDKVEKAVREVVEAFKPLTDALANEDSALSKMVTANIADLERLQSEVQEVFRNIETLSTKQFNMTNVISNGNTTSSDLELFRSLKKEAREVYKQVDELYTESVTTSQKLKSTPGGLSEFLNFSNVMADFDLSDLAKRIKSRSANSLGVVIDELNEWKKVLLQFNNLRNNVEAGSFNVAQYTDTSSKVRVGTKTNDKDEKAVADSSAVENNDILSKIKSLSEQVEAELAAIRSKIEETFNFATLDPSLYNVQSITDNIYQRFVDLQTQVKALDFTIESNAVFKQIVDTNADDTANAIRSERNEADMAGESFSEAADAKKKFAKANADAAKSADITTPKLKEEGDAAEDAGEKIEQSAGKLVEANDKFDKIKYINNINEDLSETPRSKTTVGTNKRERAYETETKFYKWNEDKEEYIPEAITIVKDFKKRSAELKRETAKIELAKKTVAKFLSQFDNKTAGHGGDVAGFAALESFEIKSLDDIENAMQQMIALDTTYNELTKNFRKGTKSMNPFVNAFNSMDEMRNKVQEVEISFNDLKSPTDTLKKQVSGLPQLLDNLNASLTPDETGVVDIERISVAYGNLNEAIKQANSSIGLQRKAERSDAAKTKAEEKQIKSLHQLYDEQAKSAAKIHEYRKQLKSGSLGKEEARLANIQIKQEQERFDAIQRQIKGYGELHDNMEQVATITHDLYVAETKLNAAQEKKENKEHQKYGKTITSRENRYAESIEAKASRLSSEVTLSEDFLGTIEKHKSALSELQSLRDRFEKDPDAFNNDALKKKFQQTALEVETLRREIISTFNAAQKFESIPDGQILRINEVDPKKLNDTKLAMIDFANESLDGKFNLEGFNSAGTEMYGTLDKGEGVIEEVTVALRNGTNQLYAYSSGTKTVTSGWSRLAGDLKSEATRLIKQYVGLHEVFQAVKKGVTYVREIDSALTELKKVTDETDASYNRFLQSMSRSADAIGSTVKDLTTSASDWARLGSIIKSAPLYSNI